MLACIGTDWPMLTWLRYNLWIPLYPLGVIAEGWCVSCWLVTCSCGSGWLCSVFQLWRWSSPCQSLTRAVCSASPFRRRSDTRWASPTPCNSTWFSCFWVRNLLTQFSSIQMLLSVQHGFYFTVWQNKNKKQAEALTRRNVQRSSSHPLLFLSALSAQSRSDRFPVGTNTPIRFNRWEQFDLFSVRAA